MNIFLKKFGTGENELNNSMKANNIRDKNEDNSNYS